MTATLAPPGTTDIRQRANGSPTLVIATVLMGLIAGFFYAYACSVMIGLAETDDHTFISTMQAINATVRNAAFAPSFFGALLVTAAATVVHIRRRDRDLIPWVAAGLALYAVAFVITMGASVPLNEQLADAGPPHLIEDLAAVRDDYEGPWVAWNIARAAASTVALGCLVVAVTRGSSGRRREEPADRHRPPDQYRRADGLHGTVRPRRTRRRPPRRTG